MIWQIQFFYILSCERKTVELLVLAEDETPEEKEVGEEKPPLRCNAPKAIAGSEVIRAHAMK